MGSPQPYHLELGDDLLLRKDIFFSLVKGQLVQGENQPLVSLLVLKTKVEELRAQKRMQDERIYITLIIYTYMKQLIKRALFRQSCIAELGKDLLSTSDWNQNLTFF